MFQNIVENTNVIYAVVFFYKKVKLLLGGDFLHLLVNKIKTSLQYRFLRYDVHQNKLKEY